MTTLEARHYIATPDDIEHLARRHMEALAGGATLRLTYLRALVATAQADLGLKPGKTSKKTTPETLKTQLAAVDKTHDRFYTSVLQGVEAGLPAVDPEAGRVRDRKQLMHRRANFARSAKSTLRAWLKAGHDLATLIPQKVTKYALAVAVTRKAKVSSAVGPTVERWVGRLRRLLRAAVKTDKEGTVTALENAMTGLAQELLSFGVTPTRSAAAAARERRPFRTAKGVFWPTAAEPATIS